MDQLIPNKSKEIYADEMSSAMIGFPLSKIIFASIRKVEDGETIKEEVATITINTLSLLNGCRFIINNAQTNSDSLTLQADKMVELVKEMIKK